MKTRKISKTNVVNFSTYLGMVLFFVVMCALRSAGVLNRSMTGLLVPICCYMSMAVSLNLTVGILGELSLGHAGFMGVGAFSGIIAAQSLIDIVPSAPVRLAIAMVVGALFATVAGLIIGAPVLRLHGDYLAIVTLAFGEIIKELITCLIVGYDENGLHIDYRAVSDRDTVANFTNHAYFNLNGHGSGDILGHTLQLHASAFTPADEHTMPTGEITPVDGTCMDFRAPKTIGSGIHDPLLKPFGGYDNNFCLDGSGLRKVAEAAGDKSGIVMDVETTLEGVQLYTGNFISDRAGKNGARYASYSGFCLETQHYPDAINQPAFPSPVLRQGEPLHETTVYRFCVRK